MIKPKCTDLKLNEPTILDCDKVLAMRQEFLNTNCKFNGTCNLDLYDKYIDWLAHTINQTHGTEFNNNPSSIKHTYLVTAPENVLIGRVEIIFYYNYQSMQQCAHIVECIRPTCRRQSFGKPLLKKAIQECCAFGIAKQNISFERNSKASNDTMNKITDF